MIAVAARTPDFVADRRAIGIALARLAEAGVSGLDAAVVQSVRYALAGEGKRLRGVLLLAAYRAAGGTSEVSALAAAVEVVHAYSLVHDDLPCMDDDAMRRGRPTVHVVFGVAAASAAGLVMVPLAAQAAVDAAHTMGLSEDATGAIVRTLMQASGAGGMVGGQLLDLDGEGQSLSLTHLERVHRLKTGALISASARIGALAAGADATVLGALSRYGDAIGLAFQIADDVLDVTATTDELGKTAGKDVAFQKSTYPSLMGVDAARARAEALCAEACEALTTQGIASPSLVQLAQLIVHRRS